MRGEGDFQGRAKKRGKTATRERKNRWRREDLGKMNEGRMVDEQKEEKREMKDKFQEKGSMKRIQGGEKNKVREDRGRGGARSDG